MSRGIIIPAIPFLPLLAHDFTQLDEYQAAVGGWVEQLSIPTPALQITVNEEGKVRGLLPNPRATVLWWLLVPEARRRDVLVGSVVVEAYGDDPAAAHLLELMQSEQRFRVEALTNVDPTSWFSTPTRCTDWFSAAVSALQIEQDWDAVLDVRVSPE